MKETETKVTHTPGPWRLSNPSGGSEAYRILGLHFPQGGIDSIVGDFLNLEGDPEKFEYDSALIAAAPDMLAQMEENLGYIPCTCLYPKPAGIAHLPACARLNYQAAINKAKGGAA